VEAVRITKTTKDTAKHIISIFRPKKCHIYLIHVVVTIKLLLRHLFTSEGDFDPVAVRQRLRWPAFYICHVSVGASGLFWTHLRSSAWLLLLLIMNGDDIDCRRRSDLDTAMHVRGRPWTWLTQALISLELSLADDPTTAASCSAILSIFRLPSHKWSLRKTRWKCCLLICISWCE